MQTPAYVLHRLARMAFLQLDPDEQERVLAGLSSLVALPVGQWPANGVKRLEGEPPLYLARLDDVWRAFVQTAPGQPLEVLDIVHQGRLDASAKLAQAKAD